MNRIIKKHYPAEKLPLDLRAGLPSGAFVNITIETENGKRAPSTVETLKADLERVRSNLKKQVSIEEATERVRALRDEWDD
ncbi:hypothetical protein [Stappia stellulata]|uniref:hypothetical protein n=1 Tax=Stappia stellulata TaxID=71235 RepID=UPI00042A3533|nr:hypothetical protein [Stappia stellulata]